MMLEKLKLDYILLQKQLTWLQLSVEECRAIEIKEHYTVKEFGQFEILCSRYSRGIDFLIRKIFRTIDAYEFENQGTLIDVVNNAHKRGLFEDIEVLRIMKDVRNTIVHEYIEDALVEVFDEVLEYSEKLLVMIENTLAYIDKHIDT
jgi:hypothetical protein